MDILCMVGMCWGCRWGLGSLAPIDGAVTRPQEGAVSRGLDHRRVDGRPCASHCHGRGSQRLPRCKLQCMLPRPCVPVDQSLSMEALIQLHIRLMEGLTCPNHTRIRHMPVGRSDAAHRASRLIAAHTFEFRFRCPRKALGQSRVQSDWVSHRHCV